jgi:hypothetical protein
MEMYILVCALEPRRVGHNLSHILYKRRFMTVSLSVPETLPLSLISTEVTRTDEITLSKAFPLLN